MAESRTLEVRFVGDARQLQQTFRQVGSGAGQVDAGAKKGASGLTTMTRAATGLVAVLGASQLVRGALNAANAAGDLGEQISKNDAVFKTSADEVEEWSKTTATSIGVSQTAALEATGTFGNMLVPMGLARDRAAEMSTTMVDLAGDMASFNNADPSEVLDALRSGLAGETEPLRRFGVFLSAARVEQEALNMGLSDGTGKLSAAAKAQATYSIILKDTADAQGDFERTSGSAANQQRILAAEWQNAQAALGQALLPALIATTGALREGIQFATEHGDTLKMLATIAAAGAAGWLTYATALKAVNAAATLSQIGQKGLLATLGLSGPALVATAAAATVGYGAYVLLRDGADVSADSLRQQIDLNRQAGDAHRATTDAVNAHKDALDRLRGAEIGRREAALRVEEATLRVADAERTYGRGSVEHRRALLDLERAEQGVVRAREDHVRAAAEGVKTTRESSRAIEDEVRSTRTAADSARRKAEAVRLGIITGEEAEKITRELAIAERSAARASETAADKHRANARRARELAAATGSATPRARELRGELLRLAQQEMDLSHFVAALNAVRDAASFASGALSDFASRAATASRVRAPGGGGGGGGPRTETTASPYLQDAAGAVTFPLARVPVGSPVALTRLRGRRGRIETTKRANAERDARAAGGDEDAVREAGERAELEARKASIELIKGQIRQRRNKLVKLLARFDIAARRKVKVPKKGDERAKALQRRANMKQRENEIRDELETLAADWADLAVEAREVGDSLEALDRGDEAPTATGEDGTADSGPGPNDFLEAAAAQAQLTPGLDDDLAAARAIEGARAQEYAAAVASGDPRRIRDTANALAQATSSRQQIEATMANTAAVQANTEQLKQNFGGSVAFSYRGQSEVLWRLGQSSSDRLAGAELMV